MPAASPRHAMLQVRFEGAEQWRRNTSAAIKQASIAARETSKVLAQATAWWIRTYIEQRNFQFAALTPAYAKRKEREYGDRPILMASGRYVRSIQARSSGRGVWSVGVPVAMRALALSSEFGTRRQAPRPHWRPAQTWAAEQAVPKGGEVVLTTLAGLLAQTDRNAVHRAIKRGGGVVDELRRVIGGVLGAIGGVQGWWEDRGIGDLQPRKVKTYGRAMFTTPFPGGARKGR